MLLPTFSISPSRKRFQRARTHPLLASILPGYILLAASLPAGPARAASQAAPQQTAKPDRGVVRTEDLVRRQTVPLSRSSRFHRVPPPVEEVVVFSDSIDGLRLDSLGGWSHYDDSERPTAWHIDTFFGCQNHAWWCGRVDSSWIYDSNFAGYENSWNQFLQTRSRLDSLPNNKPVVLSFRHRFSGEGSYDHGVVEVLDLTEGWMQLASFTGEVKQGNGDCDTFTVTIPDATIQQYLAEDPQDTIPGPPLMPFRFIFQSDIYGSSADGFYDGDGWIIDNITVRCFTRLLFHDDVEQGHGEWNESIFPPVGDFFTIQSNVLTEDICSTNQSSIWVDWNPVFMSLASGLDNWLVTPAVFIDRASEVALYLDVYRNLPLLNCFYYHFGFRTKNVGDPDWSAWVDPTRLLYYGNQKDWARQKVPLAGAGGHDSLQVEIGLKDYSTIYCDGVSSPANTYAHFDNIQVTIVSTAPPSFVTRDLDLFNDTFETTAFFGDDNFGTPLGDSLAVQVNASRGYKHGAFHYRFNGAAFDSVDLQRVAPSIPGLYFADVPPMLYPPNTKLEYFFSVTDSTDASAHYPLGAITDQQYLEAAILPLKTAINLPLGCSDSLASILFVNNFVGREPEPYLASALTALGFKFDTWDVNGPTSGVGNSIGGSDLTKGIYYWPVTAVEKLLQYSTIIWHSGNMKAFTISPRDQAVIQSWIQQPGLDRNLWITGDNIAMDLSAVENEFNSFRAFTCGIQYLRDVWENLPQDSLTPTVKGVVASPSAGRLMTADGGCPLIDDFDLLTLSTFASSGKSGLFLTYPNLYGAATRYATNYDGFSTDSARVIFQGFSFNAIKETGERYQLARAIVETYFGESPCYIASAVEEDPATQVPTFRNSLAQNTPNPFNPETVIRYSVARAGPVEIRIYNVSGAMVRKLVSGPHGPGAYTARWNGTDDRGVPLSSGAYFYRLESPGFAESKKLILLR